MNSWLRLWHDMPTNPKWRTIARKAGQPIPTVIAIYTVMLVSASTNATERGRLHEWNDEDVASLLDISDVDVRSIIDAMEGKVLEAGYLTGWEKRQPKREDSSSERAKDWRERNRTQPNAEKRPDTDKDTEKKRKKEDHSLFAEWYDKYPHKVGRADASKAFHIAIEKTGGLDPLMEGLRMYIRTKPQDRSWCNPATWLNQERWLDKPATGPGIGGVIPMGPAGG